MIVVEATETVRASPEEILELVMDLDRYRAVDHKIGRVRWLVRDGNEVVASFWSRFRGLPVLSKQRMVLTPGERIEVRNVPSWRDRFLGFEGSFACAPGPDGTTVTHRYVLDFRGPIRLVAEPLVRDWLDRDIHEEVRRLGELAAAR